MLSSYYRTRLLLATASVVCFGLFWWLGAAFGIPSHRVVGASLLWQAPATVVGDLLLTAVGLIVAVVLGTALAGTLRFDAGLFAACLGLLALSVRGGTLGDVLRTQGAGPGLYLLLALELLLLDGFIGLAWSVLWLLHGRGWLQADVFRDGVADLNEPLAQKITATITHALIFFITMTLLARTDAKAQVGLSVALAGLLGSIGAHTLFPVQPSIWYWISPLIVGVVGYVAGYISPDGWIIGQANGALAPLARPLPLDYASLGVAGAIAGYWIARDWQQAKAEVEDHPTAVE